MEHNMIDLWPDILPSQEVRSPVAILREQAAILGDKTQNAITADVELSETQTQGFIYHFYLVAPALNNYYYRLFSVIHDISLYPVNIYLGEDLGQELQAEVDKSTPLDLVSSALSASGLAKIETRYLLRAATEIEFIEHLSKILQSKKTRQVISALLAQVDKRYQKLFV